MLDDTLILLSPKLSDCSFLQISKLLADLYN